LNRKKIEPKKTNQKKSTREKTQMKIVSWNVAGVRAMLKKGYLDKLIAENDYDIICLQETKAEEVQVKLTPEIMEKYPYRFWQSTKGTTQLKGLSGTTIWSKTKPLFRINPPEIDEEGRITALEFGKFIIVCVYTPNSQGLDTPRYEFRIQAWHISFLGYIAALKQRKTTIIVGDLNVAHNEIDIHKPEKHRDCAGFLDLERKQFQEYLDVGYADAFRQLYPDAKAKYTYWNQLNPKTRQNNSGWRIDYCLVSDPNIIKDCNIMPEVCGSDHCPVYLELK
jgi:exodeoxyribonuclease III